MQFEVQLLKKNADLWKFSIRKDVLLSYQPIGRLLISGWNLNVKFQHKIKSLFFLKNILGAIFIWSNDFIW